MRQIKIFSKVVEKVTNAGLHQNVISNNILAYEQYGSRSNSSTEMASYKLFNEILNALNGIFCGLKKAFDCVNYDILLTKLAFYGILGKANALINSYLKDR
jgi:hypothetical protein